MKTPENLLLDLLKKVVSTHGGYVNWGPEHGDSEGFWVTIDCSHVEVTRDEMYALVELVDRIQDEEDDA